MPSFAFVCPECGRRMTVNQRLAGKRVRCANCFEFVELIPDRSLSRASEEKIVKRKRPTGPRKSGGPHGSRHE